VATVHESKNVLAAILGLKMRVSGDEPSIYSDELARNDFLFKHLRNVRVDVDF